MHVSQNTFAWLIDNQVWRVGDFDVKIATLLGLGRDDKFGLALAVGAVSRLGDFLRTVYEVDRDSNARYWLGGFNMFVDNSNDDVDGRRYRGCH